MQAAIEQLKSEGVLIDETDLAWIIHELKNKAQKSRNLHRDWGGVK